MPTTTTATTEQTPIPGSTSDSREPSPFERLPAHLQDAIDLACEVSPADRFNVAYAALRGHGYSDDVRRHLAGKVAAIATVLAEEEGEEVNP